MPDVCNVPGCDSEVGDYGAWCSEHYRSLEEVHD